MTTEVDSGFARPEVQRWYARYMTEHFGELDVINALETAYNAGERHAIQTMTEFSDLLPQVSRIELRVRAIRRLLLEILSEAEDVEQEALF